MFKKVLVGAVLAGSMVLAGCSSNKTEKIDSLGEQVQVIENKVDQLQGDVDAMKQDVLIVRGDAARANQRLDNQAQSYRK